MLPMKKAGIVALFPANIVWLPMGRGFLVQKVASLLNKGELSFFAKQLSQKVPGVAGIGPGNSRT